MSAFVDTGVWLLCDQTGEMIYLETSPGSIVQSCWPSEMDSQELYITTAAADKLLDAAANSPDSLNLVLRQKYLNDPRGLMVEHPKQSDYWQRMAMAGSLGAQVVRKLNGSPVTINDTYNNRIIGRNTGPSSADGSSGRGATGGGDSGGAVGGGGGGHGSSGSYGYNPASEGDTNTVSTDSGAGGRSYTDAYTSILAAATFNSLRAGGKGGVGGGSGGGHQGLGGNSGTGIVRVSTTSLAINHSRSGSDGGDGGKTSHPTNVSSGGGGGGSGGLVYIVVGGSCSGRASCSGGGGGDAHNGNRSGGRGGNGRVVLFYGNSNTLSVSSAAFTSYQMFPATPSRPSAPTISSIGALSGRVNWRAPSSPLTITRYDLRHGRLNETPTVKNVGLVTTSLLTGLSPSVSYRAGVRARNAQGAGSWSNYKEFTTRVGTPGTPDTPTISNLGLYTAQASWDAPSTPLTITRYDVGL